jgi:hypothetical protein
MGGNVSPASRLEPVLAALLVVPFWLSTPVAAAERRGVGWVPPPHFDIAASCASVADQVTCARIERGAKAQLAPVWNGLSQERKLLCQQRGANAGNSYVAALSCAKGA